MSSQLADISKQNVKESVRCSILDLSVCMKQEGGRVKKGFKKGFEILSLFRLQATMKLRNGLEKIYRLPEKCPKCETWI